MQYKALLFDLDGTLVDTIALYEQACIQALAENGLSVSAEQFLQWYMEGWHLHHVLAHFGTTEDAVPTIRARRDELYMELLSSSAQWLPGAQELLESLSSTSLDSSVSSKLALITGSWLTYVDAIDAKLHVKKYFETIVTVDDMGKFPKPHPHGLLIACERLKIEPKDCIYIGDQMFDVEAAHAAGMECVIIEGKYTPKKAVEGADRVFDCFGSF
jgi:HAD superfamily hydrolase (TIGR01509 family)